MQKDELNKLYEEWKELGKIIKSALASEKRKYINSRDILRQLHIKNLLKLEVEFLKELNTADQFEINKD